MKKIVALVLCLALALSLCTVAMADSLVEGTTSSKSVDVTGYKLLDLVNNNNDVGAANGGIKTIMKAEKTERIEVKGSTTTTTYYANMYTTTMENASSASDVTHFYEVDKTFANYKLVNGSTTIWLYNNGGKSQAGNYAVSTTIKADSYQAQPDDAACGEYDDDVYVSGTKAYEAAADAASVVTWAIYNGKFVGLEAADTNDTEPAVEHIWTDALITYNKIGDNINKPVSITCDECDKTFAVVKTLVDHNGDDSTFIDGDTITTVNGKLNGYFVILKADSAASTGSTSTTVESAKTFDAGIALYAGMALASVAGSAVVIGKKKEF